MRNFIKKYKRHIAAFFLLNFLTDVFSPPLLMALTSGPSQPEVQEFQAINVSDMVDPSTGDYSYNLPLLEVDGYPVNLSYRAGGTMEQEATCVGFGWNMNVGSIARNLRGIPDDFNGDRIIKKTNMKDNVSFGVTVGIGGELFGLGAFDPSISLGLSYNNYSGYDFVQKMGFSINLGSHPALGFGISSSSDGLTIAPTLSFQKRLNDTETGTAKGSVSLGTSYNSRTGIRELSLQARTSYGMKNQTLPTDVRDDDDSKFWTKGLGGSSSITFGSPTYIPQITMPMHTNAIMTSFKLGGSIFAVDLTGDISANYSRQKLISKVNTYPAYGYLNLHNGQGAEDVMLDFNREKDGSFTEATTDLPIPNLTYDNFSVMGQGVGGQFRPFRSEVGHVFDPRANNTSESNSLGVEVKLGNLVQGGVDFVNTSVDGTSGKWSDENNAINTVRFSGSGYTGYEPAYFKEMGEMNVDDDPLYDNIKQALAVRFELGDRGKSTGIEASLIAENSTTFDLDGKNKRSKRIKRNQLFSYLTVKECENFALQTSLFANMAKGDGMGGLANGHHIGEITTTKTDGTRFVYGYPVYNNLQKEVSFNVSGFSFGDYTPANNMVLYTPGVDDTENNTKGVDNFFSSTETPPYAYAYLLTAVLSSDYVDKTGDGPSSDDVGTYTLFRYDNGVVDYKWRSPVSNGGNANHATLDPGALTLSDDNKASYVYGVKDIRYLTSVEGKNHIAVFEYSDRQDARPVNGDAGGTNTSTNMQKKLNQITLYSMNDYLANNTGAFKIKQVHLNYNYEICYNVENFGGAYSGLDNGKLTLKMVYFTYGSSNKGVLSPYRFNYNLSANSVGIAYNPSCIDRWGNFKPSNPACPNSIFPYVEQDKTIQDENAALWSLRNIQLPSGGIMEMQYESDDYAYIQNKRAGEMFKVVGCADVSNPSSIIGANNLFDSGGANTYLFFNLKPGMTVSPSTFRRDYLHDLDYLYFNFYTYVNTGSDHSNLNFGYDGHEFIHGYAEIDRNPANNLVIGGISTIGGTDYGYVKVKMVRESKTSTFAFENPISKAAWQFARTRTPKQAYNSLGGTDPASSSSDIESIIRAIANSSFVKNTIQTFQGYNGALKAQGFGQTFRPELSWMRLSNPDFRKLGGGLRVKTITIRDQWDWMYSWGDPFQYGQEYSYTIRENYNEISSGVASYEPTFGADENSFRQPVFMDDHKQEALLAPDNDMYLEKPMGESFFPSPTVIYSQVEIKSLVAGAGKTVNEYYTSKDFPTIVHELGMDAERKKPNPIWQLFKFAAYDRFTGSQGYSIELNDMAGKPKAIHTFEEGAEQAINSTHYLYKRSGSQLVNTVKIVSKNGSIRDAQLGVDFDFYADFRENNSFTEAVGVQGNLYTVLLGIFPLLFPPILPSYHSDDIQLRTAVTNKVIYRYGIIDKVVTMNNNQASATNNLLWDEETGQVLLTGVTTEFEDPLYSMAYPGHWAYEGLAGGYKNVGLEITNPSTVVDASGRITNPTYKGLLYPGDELGLTETGGTVHKGYVDKVGNDYFFTKNTVLGGTQSSTPLDQSDLSGFTHIKVIRSGRHNLQDQKVGAVTSFTSPLYNNPAQWPVLDDSYGITNATSIEFGNTWQGYCGCDFVAEGTSATTAYPNQYIYGIKGNERKVKDYTYLTNRKQTKLQGNSNIRVDGTFEKFSPFWTPNAGNDWKANTTNWTWVSESTRNSPYGFDLENKDALERRGSAQYGYNQSLPVAVTANSKYKLAANENFEYNDLDICQDNHLGFNLHKAATYVSGSGVKVQKYSHTGKRSIKVAPTGTVMVSKQINQCTN